MNSPRRSTTRATRSTKSTFVKCSRLGSRQLRLGREEAPVDALGRLPAMELGQRRGVVGADRTDVDGLPVAEDDVAGPTLVQLRRRPTHGSMMAGRVRDPHPARFDRGRRSAGCSSSSTSTTARAGPAAGLGAADGEAAGRPRPVPGARRVARGRAADVVAKLLPDRLHEGGPADLGGDDEGGVERAGQPGAGDVRAVDDEPLGGRDRVVPFEQRAGEPVGGGDPPPEHPGRGEEGRTRRAGQHPPRVDAAQPQGDLRVSVAAQPAGHDDDVGPIEVGEGLLDQLGPARPGDRAAAPADRDHAGTGDPAEHLPEGLGLVGQDAVIGDDRDDEHVRPSLASAVRCHRRPPRSGGSLAQSAQ